MPNSLLIKSASIILQRTTGEVFLAKRANTVSFFPGFWVFPGGKIEDELPETWDGTEFEVIETIFQELYEETGIIVGSDWIVPPKERIDPYFVHPFNEEKRNLFKEQMGYIGKKDTPPFLSKIYSAAYYHIKSDLIDDLNPEVDNGELVEGEWILPEDAIAEWISGDKMLPPPILHILRNMKSPHFASITLSETFLPIGLQTKIELVPNIQAIPISSNTIDPFTNTNLVIIGNHNPIIVDPGSNQKGKEHFEQLLLSLQGVPSVFLTHHHKDHIDGLSIIESIFPESVVMGHKNTLSRITTSLNTKIVKDGEILNTTDLEVKVLHLPGHTDGHMGLYYEKYHVLIAGDHVVGFGSAVLDPEYGSMIKYFETTKMLQNISLKIIVPAHGPPNFNPYGLLQKYIDHRLKRENAIWDAVQKGNHDLESIVRVVYQDVPEKMWGYAKRNISLHLEKLAQEKELPESLKF